MLYISYDTHDQINVQYQQQSINFQMHTQIQCEKLTSFPPPSEKLFSKPWLIIYYSSCYLMATYVIQPLNCIHTNDIHNE